MLAIELVCLGALLLGNVPADEPPRSPPLVFVTDPRLEMEGGVRSAISVSELFFRYDDLVRGLEHREDTALSKTGGLVQRTARLLLVDAPLMSLGATFVHEFYGHAARAREWGGRPSIRLNPPMPYRLLTNDPGEKSGYADQSYSGDPEWDVPMVTAGIESQYLTARWISQRSLQRDGWIHYGQMISLLTNKLAYVSEALHGLDEDADDTNDLDAYVGGLMRRYNLYQPEDRVRVARRVETAYLWNFLDPTFWQAAYHLVVTYLFHGERWGRLAGFDLGGFHLQPRTWYALSPFGPEHSLDLTASRGGALYGLYVRVGAPGFARHGGGGLQVLGHPISPGLRIGGTIDLWSQPELLFGHRYAFDPPHLPGAAASLSVSWSPHRVLGVELKLAAKTKGYLMGQPLAAGPYGYMGLSLALDDGRLER